MENTSLELAPSFSKENIFTPLNIVIVLIALFLFYKYFKKPVFWIGVGAVILLGVRFYAGEKPIKQIPEPEIAI